MLRIVLNIFIFFSWVMSSIRKNKIKETSEVKSMFSECTFKDTIIS